MSETVKHAILLAKQRSGTRALGSALAQVESINYRNEIFHANAQKKPGGFFKSTQQFLKKDIRKWLPERRIELFEDFMRWDAERHSRTETSSDVQHLVYDVKYNQTHHFEAYIQERWTRAPRFINYLIDHKIPVIHLVRENVAATYFSVARASQTQTWHIRAGEVQEGTYSVNTEQMLREITARERELRAFRRWLAGHPQVMEVTYEGLYTGDAISSPVFSSMLEFLGVKNRSEITLAIGRQSSGNYESEIENWPDVKRALSSNGFGKYLEQLDQRSR